MPITVTPIEGLSDHINDIRLRTARIVNDLILPNESLLWSTRRGKATDEARAEAKALRAGDPGDGQERGAVGTPPAA